MPTVPAAPGYDGGEHDMGEASGPTGLDRVTQEPGQGPAADTANNRNNYFPKITIWNNILPSGKKSYQMERFLYNLSIPGTIYYHWNKLLPYD